MAQRGIDKICVGLMNALTGPRITATTTAARKPHAGRKGATHNANPVTAARIRKARTRSCHGHASRRCSPCPRTRGAAARYADADVAAPQLTGDQRNLLWHLSWVGRWMRPITLVVLVYADIATTFHHTKTDVAFLTTATLAMRPVGALLFGRVSRRGPADGRVSFYSVIGFLCAFAPSPCW